MKSGKEAHLKAHIFRKALVRVYLLILFIFPLLAFAKNHCDEYPSVDHTSLWPKNSIRNQCDTGSCHSFATVSLLEAKYKQIEGDYIDLSERDLFERHFGAKDEKQAKKMIDRHLDVAKRAGRDIGHWTNRMAEQKKLNGWTDLQTLQYYSHQYYLYDEGGYVSDDFSLVKKYGICQESELPFSWYEPGNEGSNILTCLRTARYEVINKVGECKLDNTYKKSEVDELCKNVSETLEKDGVVKGLIIDSKELCKKQRKEVKSFAKKLKLISKMPPRPMNDNFKKELHEYLSCHPLALDMSNYGHILTGDPVDHHAKHVVTLAGYDCKSNQFIIRNSWGGSSYDRVDADKALSNLDKFHVLFKSKSKDCK